MFHVKRSPMAVRPTIAVSLYATGAPSTPRPHRLTVVVARCAIRHPCPPRIPESIPVPSVMFHVKRQSADRPTSLQNGHGGFLPQHRDLVDLRNSHTELAERGARL